METKTHYIKRLGRRVMAHTLERQVVALHLRVALLNRLTQLVCPTTVHEVVMAHRVITQVKFSRPRSCLVSCKCLIYIEASSNIAVQEDHLRLLGMPTSGVGVTLFRF